MQALAIAFAVLGLFCLHRSGAGAGVTVLALLAVTIVVAVVLWARHRTPRERPRDDRVARVKIQELRSLLSPYFPRLEHLPIVVSETTSYTINKERVFLCLFDEHGQLYHHNMLVYVLLHEYAHVINSDVGHTHSFHTTFEKVLRTAQSVGLYDPSIPLTDKYCDYYPNVFSPL